ncbi:uncharacterized protein LOC135688139 isoform X1 [Rhopilema esculentum]|uniref:uncharacterized protein LOC135688139 isoform X1 n=1 Tax=Rhopilema esculentum TaxID=499914 RepID=UPI0031DA73AB
MNPADFLGTYVCVLFIEDFKYDVVHERHIERSAKAKANSPKPQKGELVKASGYCAKIFRIGTEEECLQELKRLEKALDVLENSDLQETNKEGVNDDDDDGKVLEDSETEFEDDDLTMLPEDKEIEAEQKRVETLLKKRKLASMEKNKHTSCNHETEINKLKIQMSNMNEKISILMDLVKQKPEEVAVRTPLRKEEPSLGENSPKNCSPVIFKGIDLTSGHCPSKPNLFATQKLSVLFKNEEMETMTLDPSPKSGKGTLDPERISILFDAVNAVYGEKKTAKWRESINKAIKQKCLDKLKIKRKTLLI